MKKFLVYMILFFNVASANVRVSIITSVFKGDPYIEQFMEEIVKQTIFDQCELILINANSPGNEESIIMPYLERYPNIFYMKLDKDPGIYAVWNIAIKLSHGEYIANANLDDGLAYDAYEVFAKTLDENPDIDLVYSDYYVPYKPHQYFYDLRNGFQGHVTISLEFSYEALLRKCMPHNHPMWRKSMHEKYGYFDETYFSAGDFEMWLRAASQGSRFKRIPGFYGFYYYNRNGLSGNPNSKGPSEIERLKLTYNLSE